MDKNVGSSPKKLSVRNKHLADMIVGLTVIYNGINLIINTWH